MEYEQTQAEEEFHTRRLETRISPSFPEPPPTPHHLDRPEITRTTTSPPSPPKTDHPKISIDYLGPYHSQLDWDAEAINATATNLDIRNRIIITHKFVNPDRVVDYVGLGEVAAHRKLYSLPELVRRKPIHKETPLLVVHFSPEKHQTTIAINGEALAEKTKSAEQPAPEFTREFNRALQEGLVKAKQAEIKYSLVETAKVLGVPIVFDSLFTALTGGFLSLSLVEMQTFLAQTSDRLPLVISMASLEGVAIGGFFTASLTWSIAKYVHGRPLRPPLTGADEISSAAENVKPMEKYLHQNSLRSTFEMRKYLKNIFKVSEPVMDMMETATHADINPPYITHTYDFNPFRHLFDYAKTLLPSGKPPQFVS